MKYIIRCSSCGKKNNVSEENIDKKLRCGHCQGVFRGSDGVVEGTDLNYERLINSGLSVLVFYSDTCPHCIGVKNSLKNLSAQYENIKFLQINSGYNRSAVMKYGIRGVPSIYLIKDGRVVENIPGAIDEFQLKGVIDNILK